MIFLIPWSDRPRPAGHVPWATALLIAINVVVFAVVTVPLQLDVVAAGDPAYMERLTTLTRMRGEALPNLPALSAYDLAISWFGFIPAQPGVVPLITSMFLHGGFTHILGNMFYLSIYGPNIEHRLSIPAFLAVYVASGVISTLGFAAFALGSHTPLIGASGALSGVLGMHFVLLGDNRITFRWGLFPVWIRAFELPSRVVILAFVVVDNILPLLAQASSSVAYGAHLAGFVGGAAFGVYLRFVEVRALDETVDAPPDDPGAADLARGEALAADGLLVDACAHFLRAVERGVDPDLVARARGAIDALDLSPVQRELLEQRVQARNTDDITRPL